MKSKHSLSAARGAAAALLALTASACGVSCKRGGPKPVVFERAVIQVKGLPVRVEVANTDERRERGLMYRQSLPADAGMLFVYPAEDTLSFWMKNTTIPLDIAFIKADGWICDIQQMAPGDLGAHDSAMKAKFALEMNRGWFKAHDVTIGDRVEIPPQVADSAH